MSISRTIAVATLGTLGAALIALAFMPPTPYPQDGTPAIGVASATPGSGGARDLLDSLFAPDHSGVEITTVLAVSPTGEPVEAGSIVLPLGDGTEMNAAAVGPDQRLVSNSVNAGTFDGFPNPFSDPAGNDSVQAQLLDLPEPPVQTVETVSAN